MPMAVPNPFNRADYLLAAHTHRQLPPDGGREVAFAGRSNAGKSSALNALCGRNALARVSKRSSMAISAAGWRWPGWWW